MRVCVYCEKEYNKTGRGVYCNDRCKRAEYRSRKKGRIEDNNLPIPTIDKKWLVRGAIST